MMKRKEKYGAEMPSVFIIFKEIPYGFTIEK
jgi:hypothetical protein